MNIKERPRMVGFKKRGLLITVLCVIAALALLFITVPGIRAYLTDMADPMENNFTIALDTTTTVVEKFPENVPDMNESGLASFYKLIQIANTGYVDCFVRVRINFSETEIRDESSFTWDGEHWYSYAEYKDHLPDGWVYNPDDDCFYYKNVLIAGDWEDFSKNLIYDAKIGEYFYKNDDDNILEGDIITTPLFVSIKTQFKDNHDMRTFTIYVAEESCPFYLGTDYAEAWETYDAEEWDLHPSN